MAKSLTLETTWIITGAVVIAGVLGSLYFLYSAHGTLKPLPVRTGNYATGVISAELQRPDSGNVFLRTTSLVVPTAAQVTSQDSAGYQPSELGKTSLGQYGQ